MPERQVHGFLFEEEVINKLGLNKSSIYTSPFDAYDDKGNPYQIKYIKKGSSIDLGDYFVNSSKEKDFNLIIGFWEKEKNNIIDVFNLFIEKDKWNKILYYDKSDELKEWIRDKVSNEYSYDEIWKEEIKEWKKDYGKRKILLRFKRDHKTQRRIQCAINKKDFYDYFLKEFKFEQIRIR